ncbi:serine-threonine protein kinase 19-domain-containing protein [Umbelopsis sp. PMI_123]|nr:serine-threonine protein kinase 19-domain-containing protein [Umbelopsis sp. PMI_123]
MSSSSKRARLRYAESLRDTTHVPDTYNQRRKEVRKVIERIEKDQQEEFDDIPNIVDHPDNAAIEEAFDTYNALRYFIYSASLPSSSKASIPRICFLHQLYSILPDNTAVDRELNILVQNMIVRKFRVGGTLEDELVIMFLDDYLLQIDAAKTEFENEVSSGEVSAKAKAIDRFRDIVTNPKFTDVAISRNALTKIVGFNETEISHLVIYGLFVIHTQDSYLFAIRGAGTFMTPFIKGRVEILRILKRRQTRDILEKQWRTKKLRNSIFTHEFHLHDLLGSGRVERQKTTMGDLIKLTKKGEACI